MTQKALGKYYRDGISLIKHLDRYVTEFAGKHNNRSFDTIYQMENIVRGMVGKQLAYKELVA